MSQRHVDGEVLVYSPGLVRKLIEAGCYPLRGFFAKTDTVRQIIREYADKRDREKQT
jgi:hypothetical protein